jgi:hypothetical protein
VPRGLDDPLPGSRRPAPLPRRRRGGKREALALLPRRMLARKCQASLASAPAKTEGHTKGRKPAARGGFGRVLELRKAGSHALDSWNASAVGHRFICDKRCLFYGGVFSRRASVNDQVYLERFREYEAQPCPYGWPFRLRSNERRERVRRRGEAVFLERLVRSKERKERRAKEPVVLERAS